MNNNNTDEKETRTWKIPVTWEMCGVVCVNAPTLAEAMAIARDEESDIPIPDDDEYVGGSWQLSCDDEDLLRMSWNDGLQDCTVQPEVDNLDLEDAAADLAPARKSNGRVGKVVVCRPTDGIAINGELECLLDAEGGVRIFDSKEQAEAVLRRDGYGDEDLCFFTFLESYGVCRRCGSPLFKSLIPEYSYQCFTCDEDFYAFEQEGIE